MVILKFHSSLRNRAILTPIRWTAETSSVTVSPRAHDGRVRLEDDRAGKNLRRLHRPQPGPLDAPGDQAVASARLMVSGTGEATQAAPVRRASSRQAWMTAGGRQGAGPVVNRHVGCPPVHGLKTGPDGVMPLGATLDQPLYLFPALGVDHFLKPLLLLLPGDDNDLPDLPASARKLPPSVRPPACRVARQRACQSPSGGCCQRRRSLRKPWGKFEIRNSKGELRGCASQ